jgi:hypothetical protein
MMINVIIFVLPIPKSVTQELPSHLNPSGQSLLPKHDLDLHKPFEQIKPSPYREQSPSGQVVLVHLLLETPHLAPSGPSPYNPLHLVSSLT